MKKVIISLAVVMATLASCKQSDSVVLSGKIENAAGEKIFLEQVGSRGTLVVDSAVVGSNGEFELASPIISEPTFYKATLLGNKTITFIADSLGHIQVTADANSKNWLNDIKFSNSEESAQLQQFIAQAQRIQTYAQFVRKNESMSESDKSIANDSIVSMLKEYKNSVQQNVFNNPRSWANYYALYQYILDVPMFDIMNSDDQMLFNVVATNLKIAYPNSEKVSALCNEVLQARAIQKRNKQNEELLANAIEVKSPDLALPNKDGETVKLSSLRGKTVILQFWASYDQNSRESNRQLLKLYKRYHDRGLEIYQVSFDTSKVLWEAAMQKDEMTWINVCDLQGQNSIAMSIYNVSSIPSNYIIAPDGALIGKDLFAARLDSKMAEIFK